MDTPLRRLRRRIGERLYVPPRGIDAGPGIRFERPRQVIGPSRIRIGARTLICRNAKIWAIEAHGDQRFEPRIDIGSDVSISEGLWLTCVSSITVGDGCVLSEGVFLTDYGHGFDPREGLIMPQRWVLGGPIHLARNCFVGIRSVIMPGVSLGENCVVGAQSVVTRSFPAGSMVGGSPARLIRRYNPGSGAWESASSAYEPALP